jgi:hypothetical protein
MPVNHRKLLQWADEARDAYRQALARVPGDEEAWQKLVRRQP